MEDYEDSAARHWTDAELLCGRGRLDNADRLYGIATECALKTALRHPPTHPDAGGLARTYRLHVDELWDSVSINAVPKHFPGLIPLLKAANPFADWRIAQRYDVSGNTTVDTLEKHRQIAKRVLAAVRIVGQRGASDGYVR